jgi:phage-related holin
MIQDTTAALSATLKTNGWPIFGIIASLLSPIKWLMILVAIFITADTIAGIWSSIKLNKKLESRKFARFITKMLIYQVVVITAYALDKLLLGEFFLLFISIPMVATKLATLALIVAEIFSIDEKLKNVNEEKGIWYHFSRLLKIAKFIKKEADELTKDKIDDNN